MSLEALIEQREILVCCGSGGVGKTTVSAAIALEGAARGKKTLVLTIDPARRLANAMGLTRMGNEQTRIPEAVFRKAGLEVEGELWGMMLDMKRTWDELIERIAPTPEKRDLILNNQYYQTVSSALAGSQEYMAMEKLLEIHSQGAYDLIVLDTPPTKHALDFLEAPRRMSDFLEGRVIQTLLIPYAIAGKAGLGLLRRGTATVASIMEKITGVQVLQDLAEFFLSFEGLSDGFKERALKVNQLLRSRRTAFLLVASPSSLILRETAFFADKLQEFNMPLGAFLFNRVHQGYTKSDRAIRQVERLRRNQDRLGEIVKPAAGDDPETYRDLLDGLLANFLRAQKLSAADRTNLERFVARYRGVPTHTVPIFDEDVHDLRGLARIAGILFGNAGG